MNLRGIYLAGIPLLLCTTTFGQGGDYCYAPQAITGTGNFAFDNTAATTDGLPDTLCNFFGQTGIDLDIWFSWTAPSTGAFTITTCSQTGIDSKIALYDGGVCTSNVIACNDDACALQSQMDVSVVGGTTYLLRVGVYPGSAGGTGNVSIVPVGSLAVLDTRTNPANGHTYHLLTGGSWSAAEATAVSLGGHLATINDQAEHDWVLAQWHNFQTVDIDMWIGFNDVAIEGAFVWADGTPVGFTNWDLAEPNDGGTGEDYTAMRKNNPAAFWNDLANAPTGFHANPHGVVEVAGPAGTPFCSGDGSGTACPCGNSSPVGNGEGCLHSLGTGGKIGTSGNASVGNDTLVLQGSLMPNAPCLYFQGTTQLNGGAGSVFGDGLRCAGGSIKRLGTKPNVAGSSQYPSGSEPPVHIRGLCNAGDVRTYQIWFRNAAAFCTAATFNLTNGVQLTWLP